MKLGLVLSGGGSRGAFEAGVIAAMEQAGLRPAVVSGTSAGALNAAGMAAGLGADSLATWWGSIADAQVYRMRRDIWRLLRPAGLLGPGNVAARLLRSVGWTWLWDIEPLRRTVIEALGGQRVPSRDDLVLAVSAVEVTSGELVRFVSARPPPERRSDRYRAVDIDVDHLLASAAVPLLFKPARVGGVLHWDGGIVANTPIAPALAFEPDAVIVVMTARRDRKRPEPASLADAVGRYLDAVQRFSLEADLARAHTINELVRSAPRATTKRFVDLLVVEPDVADLGDALNFDPATARRLIAAGHDVGSAAIARWRSQGRLPEPPARDTA
ncbi:MAG: patatin-like phospholipase family protein [Actinomycetota bacterium]|jgi:NTE family protein|nr:patatin-like phospholipase family protein [Euzebyaceae bacterium]MDQ3453541.1 patatin-like phospholipase family protein [Actinomycetota bacterium]